MTNNDDPARLGRVRVRHPALGDELEGAWARIAGPSAGAGRGLVMLPLVGEEVLIGFEHDDTRRPYVLGSLFNGADPPGDELLQDDSGSFAMRSTARLYVEAQEQMTIKGAGGLALDVAGDVDEHVDGARTSATSGATTLSSTGAFEIQARTVSIEGPGSLELRCGPSSIQLSSAGVTIAGPVINLG